MSDLGRPDFRISCAKLLATRGCLVYAWVRGPKVLYVGMSRTGLLRPINASHEVCWAFEPSDELLIWRAIDKRAAERLEALAIRLLAPAYNAKGAGGHGCLEPRPQKPDPFFEDDDEPAEVCAPTAHNLSLFADATTCSVLTRLN
jgi:hypothetical protein